MAVLSRYNKTITSVWRRTAAKYLSKKRGKVIKPWLKGDVLDIGCGGESSLIDFLTSEQRYIGIDIQQDLIQRLRLAKPLYEFYCVDIDSEDNELLSTIKSQFDTIAMLAVIEHLRNPQIALKQCWNSLRRGGTLIITTPTSRGDKLIRLIKRGLRVKQEEGEGYSPHLTSFNEQTLKNLMTENKFKPKIYKKFELNLNQLIIASKEEK